MSKAFTREDSGAEEEVATDNKQAEKLPAHTKNYITPAGHARLKNELQTLLYEERPNLTQVVAWAAGNGDRSENGDYLYGKKRLREIDRRIRFLTRRLEIAEIIDPAEVKAHKIQFGASVTIQNEAGKKRVIQIVGIDEIDPTSGKVSWISPLAKILLGNEVGDAVVLRSPKGEEEIEILKVEYR